MRALRVCEFAETEEKLEDAIDLIAAQLVDQPMGSFDHVVLKLIYDYLEKKECFKGLTSYLGSIKNFDKTKTQDIERFLASFFARSTSKPHEIMTKLTESFQVFVSSMTEFDESKFAFIVALNDLLESCHTDLRRHVGVHNAGSFQLRLIVLENLLCNKTWHRLRTREFSLFLKTMFQAFENFEMQNDDLSKLDVDLLFDFVRNYTIENETNRADYEDIMKQFCVAVKRSYVKTKCQILADEKQKYANFK